MNGEITPTGGGQRKFDPEYARKIREGGKMAQKIAEETAKKHQEEDVPKAEEELLKNLGNIQNDHLKSVKK